MPLGHYASMSLCHYANRPLCHIAIMPLGHYETHTVAHATHTHTVTIGTEIIMIINIVSLSIMKADIQTKFIDGFISNII